MNKRDSDQKDNIERLGKINVNLSEETQKLTILIQQITSSNKQTSDENLLLTQQSKDLIVEVQKLTVETKKLTTKIDERVAYQAAENLQSGELLMDFKPNISKRCVD